MSFNLSRETICFFVQLNWLHTKWKTHFVNFDQRIDAFSKWTTFEMFCSILILDENNSFHWLNQWKCRSDSNNNDEQINVKGKDSLSFIIIIERRRKIIEMWPQEIREESSLLSWQSTSEWCAFNRLFFLNKSMPFASSLFEITDQLTTHSDELIMEFYRATE